MKRVLMAVFGGLFLGTSLSVGADRLDMLKDSDTVTFCRQVGSMFYDGLYARNINAERILRETTKEMLEADLPAPLNGIYFEELSTLNARERVFLEKIVFEGWDALDKIFKNIERTVAEDGVQTNLFMPDHELLVMANTRINSCLDKNEQKDLIKSMGKEV